MHLPPSLVSLLCPVLPNVAYSPAGSHRPLCLDPHLHHVRLQCRDGLHLHPQQEYHQVHQDEVRPQHNVDNQTYPLLPGRFLINEPTKLSSKRKTSRHNKISDDEQFYRFSYSEWTPDNFLIFFFSGWWTSSLSWYSQWAFSFSTLSTGITTSTISTRATNLNLSTTSTKSTKNHFLSSPCCSCEVQ